MTSLTLYPDMPCAYPNSVGEVVATAVGNTPKVLAVFRNNSSVASLRGLMQRFGFIVFNPSDDTLVTLQFVGGCTAVGGAWNPVGGVSHFDVNTAATGITGGLTALSVYDYAVLGNKTAPSRLSAFDAEALGLELPVGQQFAIVASTRTTGETVDIAWSVNWLEKD